MCCEVLLGPMESKMTGNAFVCVMTTFAAVWTRSTGKYVGYVLCGPIGPNGVQNDWKRSRLRYNDDYKGLNTVSLSDMCCAVLLCPMESKMTGNALVCVMTTFAAVWTRSTGKFVGYVLCGPIGPNGVQNDWKRTRLRYDDVCSSLNTFYR